MAISTAGFETRAVAITQPPTRKPETCNTLGSESPSSRFRTASMCQRSGPAVVGLEAEKAVRRGRRTAFFLGRIYPIKGLPMLVQAWARVRPDGWFLRIAGPDEAGHRKQVEKAVSAAGLGEVISFTGPIEHRNEEVCFLRRRPFCAPISFGKLWHRCRRGTCSWLASSDHQRDALVDSARERLWLVGRCNCGWHCRRFTSGNNSRFRNTSGDGRERPRIGHRRVWLETRGGAHAIDLRVDIGQCYGSELSRASTFVSGAKRNGTITTRPKPGCARRCQNCSAEWITY